MLVYAYIFLNITYGIPYCITGQYVFRAEHVALDNQLVSWEGCLSYAQFSWFLGKPVF